MPYYGNLISRWGIFGINEVLPGIRTPIITTKYGLLLTVMSIISAFVLMSHIYLNITNKDERNALIPVNRESLFFVVSSCFIYFGIIGLLGIYHDRYILPIFAVVCVLLRIEYTNVNRSRFIISFCLLSLIWFFSYSLAYDYLSWNKVKWNLAVEASNKYTTADKIDAGYEWIGWYQHKTRKPEEWSTYPYIISFSPVKDYKIIKVEEYNTILSSDRKLYLLKKESDY